MQLPNMELNERTCQALYSHDIHDSLTYLFLKPCLDFVPTSNKEPIFHYLSYCFELSTQWLAGSSESVSAAHLQDSIIPEKESSLKELLNYLIQCKWSGWKPKMVFVKPLEPSNDHKSQHLSNANTLMFIELSKMTKTGIAFTTYKPWNANIYPQALLLFQAIELFYKGLVLPSAEFHSLQVQRVIPAAAFKKAQNLFNPEYNGSATEKSLILEKSKELLEAFKVTVPKPTHLNEI